MTADARSVLIRVIRVAFPHDSFPDGPYERTTDTILVDRFLRLHPSDDRSQPV